jgi:hypothetical protein
MLTRKQKHIAKTKHQIEQTLQKEILTELSKAQNRNSSETCVEGVYEKFK